MTPTERRVQVHWVCEEHPHLRWPHADDCGGPGMPPTWRGIVCEECGRAPEQGERFRAYLTVDDEVAVYCPQHAEREFGRKTL